MLAGPMLLQPVEEKGRSKRSRLLSAEGLRTDMPCSSSAEVPHCPGPLASKPASYKFTRTCVKDGCRLDVLQSLHRTERQGSRHLLVCLQTALPGIHSLLNHQERVLYLFDMLLLAAAVLHRPELRV